MYSFPHRQQPNAKDCGATCLYLISAYYGKRHSLDKLREYSHISREGASLMGISEAAERIGFKTLGLCLDMDKLANEVRLPCILFWNQNHYVVCYKIRRGRKGYRFYLSDPASIKTVCSEEEFRSHWLCTRRNGEDRGILLQLCPTDLFYTIEGDEKKPRFKGLAGYFTYIAPYKGAVAQMIFSMLLLMFLGLFAPFLTQVMVDVGIREGNFSFVMLVLLSQLILTLTNMGVGMINGWLSLHTNTRVSLALFSDFWKKLLKLPAKFFDTKILGDLMQRLEDYDRIESFLLGHSIQICFSIVSFVVFTSILAYYNVTILMVFLVGHVLYVLWTIMFLGTWKRLDYENFELSSKSNNKIIQMLQGVVDIKLNNEENLKRWEWEKIQARLFRLSVRRLKVGQLQGNVSTLITNVTNLLISAITAQAVIGGSMTLGMMMAISYVTAQIGAPISQFVGFVHVLQETKISLERLDEIHSMPDDDSLLESQQQELPTKKDISFEHVNFSYDGSPHRLVLKDVSLTILANKVTALVGDSGCGKTTVIKLIQGLYEPLSGAVKIDGIPISCINPHQLRRQVGSVMQEGYLFSDTIARNVATGTTQIDRQRLHEAARLANVDSFVGNLPLGYNTKIGMEGVGVSQGQKQRILIARLIYKSPEILLLDEATNSLDSKNEKSIMSNLQACFKNKTVVMAAHRLSTIRNADQIIVMKDGRVEEVGTHSELLARRGEYYALIENQL